jgi:hypothetical protein
MTIYYNPNNRRLKRGEVNSGNIPKINSDDPLVKNDNPDLVQGITLESLGDDIKRYPIMMSRDEMWHFRLLLSKEKDEWMQLGLRNLKEQVREYREKWQQQETTKQQ